MSYETEVINELSKDPNYDDFMLSLLLHGYLEGLHSTQKALEMLLDAEKIGGENKDKIEAYKNIHISIGIQLTKATKDLEKLEIIEEV